MVPSPKTIKKVVVKMKGLINVFMIILSIYILIQYKDVLGIISTLSFIGILVYNIMEGTERILKD